MAMKTESVEVTQRCLVGVGVAFLAACVVHAATGGWALADGHLGKGILYAAIMIAITIGAALLPTVIGKAWSSNLRGVAAVFFIAWIVCQAGEGVGNMMAMGHTRQQSIAVANVADQQMLDRRNSIADTEASIALVEKSIGERTKVAGWLSVKPSDAWKADIANLEGDKLYARSKQCSNVTLPDSRAHCDKLREARANLATATTHEADAARLEKSKAALVALREQSRDDKPGISASRTQSDNLVKVAGMLNGKWVPAASEDDRAQANFAVQMFMLIVMMIGPAAMIYAGSMDWSPRPKRPPGSMARAWAWITGKEIDDPTASAPVTLTTSMQPHRETVQQKPMTAAPVRIRTEREIVFDHALRRWAVTPQAQKLIAA